MLDNREFIYKTTSTIRKLEFTYLSTLLGIHELIRTLEHETLSNIFLSNHSALLFQSYCLSSTSSNICLSKFEIKNTQIDTADWKVFYYHFPNHLFL